MVSSGWRGGAWLAPCGLVLLLVCLGGGQSQPATPAAPPAAAVTAPPEDCTQKQHPVVSYRAAVAIGIRLKPRPTIRVLSAIEMRAVNELDQTAPSLLGRAEGYRHYWDGPKGTFATGTGRRVPSLLGRAEGYRRYWDGPKGYLATVAVRFLPSLTTVPSAGSRRYWDGPKVPSLLLGPGRRYRRYWAGPKGTVATGPGRRVPSLLGRAEGYRGYWAGPKGTVATGTGRRVPYGLDWAEDPERSSTSRYYYARVPGRRIRFRLLAGSKCTFATCARAEGRPSLTGTGRGSHHYWDGQKVPSLLL
ncbi:unnamed protein product [Boreogadus saida]